MQKFTFSQKSTLTSLISLFYKTLSLKNYYFKDGVLIAKNAAKSVIILK